MASLPSFWLRSGWLSLSLWPAEALFRFLVRWRRRILCRRALPTRLPVLIIGSIFIGGTGKTPLVRWLAERARAQGRRPGVVLRGYGVRRLNGCQRVTPESDPAVVGDEAVLIARAAQVPVVIGRDRVAAVAMLASDGECDLVLADDGLQHYRLRRIAEIVVLDSDRGLGNGRCLPAGPLREPADRLAEVDLVVGNGGPLAGLTSKWFRLEPGLPLPVARKGEGDRGPPQAGDSVHAVAGIGAPERFFRALREQGFDVTPHAFPDHHRFRASDLAFGDDRPVVMTEKDAVKCVVLDDGRLWYIPVAVAPDETLVEAASALIDRLPRPSN